jgi:GTP-binding protein
MFVDELDIYAKAGNGGDGVVRWLRLKYDPNAGPAGGNGGRGGDVYVRGVRDLSLLSKYTGSKNFCAENGEAGHAESRHGKKSEDLYIDVPVGAVITHLETGRTFEITEEDQIEIILKGGRGGLGNKHFKSSTNQTPLESTAGTAGEEGNFKIELLLTADVGLVGMPNAGKSTLLNSVTNAQSQIGSYPFTTLQPHLGSLYGYTLADIPGLIAGASNGKGLGHTFLRHIKKTKMILHLVSLEDEDPYVQYGLVTKELEEFDATIIEKKTWIVLTKSDVSTPDVIENVIKKFDKTKNRVFVISTFDAQSVKNLKDALVKELRGE